MKPSIMWLVAIVALFGTVLNAQHSIWSFYLWVATNGIFILHNARKKDWPQVILFCGQTLACIYGIWSWS